jgi:glycosyltransferase involved in cell wall biosynthesis
MRLTIGQFNESFPPIIDGVANVVKNYAYWMNRKYGISYVITPKHPQAKDNYDFEVLRYSSMKVPVRSEYRFGLPKMDGPFWKELKTVPFDIVHAHCPFGSGFAARSIAKKRDIPFVATFHSKFRDDFKGVLKSDALVDSMLAKVAAFYESADEVWCVNEASIEPLREYGYRGDAYIMENGCDIEVRYRSDEVDKEIDTKYGLKPGTPLFMYIGQHIWQKNLKMVIEALNVLKERGLYYHMLFVGDGPKRADMEQMVKDFGLESYVTFVGRIHDRKLIAKIYLRSSAMLFPSLYDTSSLVPREAAACGCPAVLVRGSSTAQGITDESAFLIKDSAQSLADAAEFIIKSPQRAREIGESARKTIYRSWEEAIDCAYERYLYLIDLKKTRTAQQAK